MIIRKWRRIVFREARNGDLSIGKSQKKKRDECSGNVLRSCVETRNPAIATRQATHRQTDKQTDKQTDNKIAWTRDPKVSRGQPLHQQGNKDDAGM